MYKPCDLCQNPDVVKMMAKRGHIITPKNCPRCNGKKQYPAFHKIPTPRPNPPLRYSEKIADEMILLHKKECMSKSEIGRKYNVSTSTVLIWINKREEELKRNSKK